jgi:predicted AAA+ superfamily ATPase
MKKHFIRDFEVTLVDRLKKNLPFIQVILGPRQVGKTTGVLRVLNSHFVQEESVYHSCDEAFGSTSWLQEKIQDGFAQNLKVIVLDEIQKIPNWSEVIKVAWDKNKRENRNLQFVILGSSSLDLSIGLSDSLAGRYEIIHAHHWSYHESKEAYGLSWDEFLKFGGYPGSYPLINDPDRFKKYLYNSIFEAVVDKDILRYSTIKKPALFRQTFQLASQYPSQEISYNKLLGQLTEAGNVEQIKHYLELFEKAFLIRKVFKKTKSPLSKSSSPKLLPSAPVFTYLFMSEELRSEEKGRLFESIVGSRLCETFEKVFYWRKANQEIDFVVENKGKLIGVEVKSQRKKANHLDAFKKEFKNAKACIIHLDNYQDFELKPKKFITENSF